MSVGHNSRQGRKLPLYTFPALLLILLGTGCSMFNNKTIDSEELPDGYYEQNSLGQVAPASAMMPVGQMPVGQMTQGNQPMAMNAPAPQGPPKMVLVEFVPSKGATEFKKMPLYGPMTVQQIIEQSGATAKFKRLDVAVSRLPQYPGGAPQKLISQYDHVNKKVPMSHDYFLQPGDRIVIVENTSGVFDDLFGATLNPIRKMTGAEKNSRSF
ncbi:MAG: hypothetical protein COA78_25415 [Blastopirellula sp.]|nr:MAG: hypothetical protein COA78_25415 [Blastopirellula sp.]